MVTPNQQRELLPGTMLGVFRIERTLGVGGFGITYLAFDTSLHVQVAIKEYFPNNAWRNADSYAVHCYQGETEQSFQVGLQRFHKEGQILAQFNHPNIVRVRQILSANNTAYLVMDYEQGEELEAYLKRLGRPLTYPEVEDIFNPLLDGLRAVHERNLLHLDIKPENIFLRADSTPVLIDFGGARHQLGQASRTVSFLVASDGYAPNEQYTGTQLQPSTDIYAVGAAIYRSITGQVPPDSPVRSNAIIDGQADPLQPAARMVRNTFPGNFIQAIDASLSMRIAHRPQSVREFQRQLFASQEPPSPPQLSSPTKPNWMKTIAWVGGAALVVFAAAFFVHDAQTQKENAKQLALEMQQQRELMEQKAANALLEKQLAEQRATEAQQQQASAQQQLEDTRQQMLFTEQQLAETQQQQMLAKQQVPEETEQKIPQTSARNEVEVMAVIDKYVKLASNQHDPYSQLKLYTEPVDYYSKKQASHEFIIKESERYASVYSTHEFRQESAPALTWVSDTEVSAVLKLGYHLCCKKGKPPSDGEQWLKLRLLRSASEWKIAAVNSEKI